MTSPATGEAALRPCPWGCPEEGEDDVTTEEYGGSWYAWCAGCRCQGPNCDTEAEAIAAWNTRAGGGAAEVRAALEEKATRIYAMYEQLHTPSVVMSKDLFWAVLDKAVERAGRAALEEAARACEALGAELTADGDRAEWDDREECMAERIRSLAASQTPPGGSDRG